MSDPFHSEPKFREDSGIKYPSFCTTYFEKYFYNYITNAYNNGSIGPEIFNKYIPVYWTEIQISSKYDEVLVTKVIDDDNFFIWKLWKLLELLPKDEPFFTIVQHDDGIKMSSISDNIMTFSMGGTGHVPIPLTYDFPAIFDNYKHCDKTLLCSFVGSVTHSCRSKMLDVFKDKPGVTLITNDWTNQVQEDKQQLYLSVMSKSRFTLAPRGYGKTSFRLYEALHLGSIPVYIYDDAWLPYKDVVEWNKMAVLVPVDELDGLYDRLLNISDREVAAMLDYYKQVEHHFTYDGICEYILNNITLLKNQ
jgi:hypothetical protein